MAEGDPAEGAPPSCEGDTDSGSPQADSNAHHKKPGNPSLIFLRWLRAFGPFAFILLLDPFGCARQAKLYSENLVLRIAAPFHGAQQPKSGHATKGQQKVLVVRIDQDSLNRISLDASGTRATWPIPRSQQVQFILQSILDKKPKAIFLDYTFNADSLPGEDARSSCPTGAKGSTAPTCTPDAGSTAGRDAGNRAGAVDPASDWEKKKDPCGQPNADQRCAIANAIQAAMATSPGTRLFLGSKPTFARAVYAKDGRDCKVPRITANALGEADDVAVTLRHWARGSRVELVTMRKYDLDHYPLATVAVGTKAEDDECGDEGEEVQGYLASPAYAMFSAYCDAELTPSQRGSLCPASVLPASYPARETIPQPDPSYSLYSMAGTRPKSLVPYWPAFRTDWQTALDQAVTSRGSAGETSGLVDYLQHCDDRRKSRLAPQLLLSWDLFKAALTRIDEPEPCRYGVDSVTLSEFVHAPIETGRYILVGLDLPDVPDPVANPLYANTPGVLLHGVALENMITYGDGYIHDSGPLIGGLEKADFWTLILGLIFSIPALFHARLHALGCRLARSGPRSPSTVLAFVLLLVGVLLILWIPLGISVGLLLWLTTRTMYANAGSFGPLAVLVIAFSIFIVVPLGVAWLLFSFLGWALIDWLVLTAALSWAPEIAFEVLDDAWNRRPSPEPAAGGLRSPWLWDLWMPAAAVILAALFVGIFSMR